MDVINKVLNGLEFLDSAMRLAGTVHAIVDRKPITKVLKSLRLTDTVRAIVDRRAITKVPKSLRH